MKICFYRRAPCIYKALTYLADTYIDHSSSYCTYSKENAFRLANKIDETFGSGVKGILCPVYESATINQYYTIEVIIEDPADEAFFQVWSSDGIEI